ncbi:TetR/AcrR family transcriptional regulator [Paenibacillus sp. IHBB 10380]|uniref:TetR/AcrR family transcriptional regulator n=1 Tax=Paenibacillus sp. IHBB 10380 TaxID=1566358 RepID=UPI0005CFE75A|nr:TetR/AcrR family transcriptional regulator [Paenibacillus sp. IHBB 10380]AJS57783.1 transcriptional regulator [Paenibacillus sp. IHBB 10380]
MSETNKTPKRIQILMAASKIVKELGLEHLTLDAVAKEAGISKGGLLYHFPTKDALILGMVQELTNRFSTEVDQKVKEDRKEKGKWSRAYLEATANSSNDMNSVLAAVLFTGPSVVEGLHEQYKTWQKNIENDGLNPVHSTIIRLVADGLWFTDMFGLAPPDDDLKKKIIHELTNWTGEVK